MTAPARIPVVLDTDGAVGAFDGELRIALRHRQEALRFGCSAGQLDRLARELAPLLPAVRRTGTAFIGSGDFHHLSAPLILRCARTLQARTGQRLRVVVLDNHPDNMRFPFGVHCGSWVKQVAMDEAVSHVHVAGITSADIGVAHCWENRLQPLRAGKLSYWSCGVDTGWARWLGLDDAFHAHRDGAELVAALTAHLVARPEPTYLSIDKDVLSTAVVQTNWDQGVLTLEQAGAVIDVLTGCIEGSDITGEISSHRYATLWKRLLSGLDGQDIDLNVAAIDGRQSRQHQVNRALLARIVAAGG